MHLLVLCCSSFLMKIHAEHFIKQQELALWKTQPLSILYGELPFLYGCEDICSLESEFSRVFLCLIGLGFRYRKGYKWIQHQRGLGSYYGYMWQSWQYSQWVSYVSASQRAISCSHEEECCFRRNASQNATDLVFL